MTEDFTECLISVVNVVLSMTNLAYNSVEEEYRRQAAADPDGWTAEKWGNFYDRFNQAAYTVDNSIVETVNVLFAFAGITGASIGLAPTGTLSLKSDHHDVKFGDQIVGAAPGVIAEGVLELVLWGKSVVEVVSASVKLGTKLQNINMRKPDTKEDL